MVVIFFTLGAASLIVQMILVRELWGAFGGNEFFVNFTLGAWLLWTAVGSFASRNLIRRLTPAHYRRALCLCLFCLAFSLVPLLFAIRIAPSLTAFTGESPDFMAGIFTALFVTLPAGFFFGLEFGLGAATFLRSRGFAPATHSVTTAYLIETLGFIVSGIVFVLWIVHQSPWHSFLLLTVFHLVLGISLLIPNERSRRVIQISSALAIAFLLFLPSPRWLGILDTRTEALKFRPSLIVLSERSPFGNIIVTKNADQMNIYENGSLLASTVDTLAAERLACLSLVLHENPRDVLYIGPAANGILTEILSNRVERLDYAESDPTLGKISRQILSVSSPDILNDPRVRWLTTSDPRSLLNKNTRRYDVILLKLPAPSSSLLNRYLTRDFFRKVKRSLNPNGILVFELPFSPSRPNRELEHLNTSVQKTLQSVFSYHAAFAEDEILWVASDSDFMDGISSKIHDRWKIRSLSTHFVNEKYLLYRLENRISFADKRLGALLNTDNHPIGYFYGSLYAISLFYPNLTKGLDWILAHSLWVMTGLFAAALLILYITRRNKGTASGAPMSMAIGGFSLMLFQSVFILAYQNIYGNLYDRLALLVSALMAGLAIGTLLIRRFDNNRWPLEVLSRSCHLGLSVLGGVAAFLFLRSSINESLFYLLSLCSGIAVGMLFYILNRRLFLDYENVEKVGIIYAWDLAGSALGIFLGPLFFVPAIGLSGSLFLIALLNLTVSV